MIMKLALFHWSKRLNNLLCCAALVVIGIYPQNTPAQSYWWDWDDWEDECEASFTASARHKTWQTNRWYPQTIRINIRFDRRTAPCVTELLFFTDNSNYLTLHSSSDSVNTNLINRYREVYPQYVIDGRIAYVVPIYYVRNLRLWAELTTTDPLIAGDYQGVVSIAASSYGTIVSEEVVTNVTMDVPSILSVSVQTWGNSAVSGSNGFYYVELGSLYQGKTAGWDLDVYSNAHYDISVESEYKGLRHSGTGELISYRVKLDGNEFDAASGYTKRYTNHAPLTYNTIPFSIEVGSTDFKPAGDYVDYLAVTVSAR